MKVFFAASIVICAAAAFGDDKDKNERDRAELRKAVDAAKIHFHDAVAVARKEVKDGRVTEVELAWEDGGPRFEVEMLAGDGWKEVLIDATNGKVLRVETDVKPDNADDRQDIAESRKALDDAKQTITQAIDVAVRDWKEAKLVEVDLERRAGDKLFYELILLEGDKLFYADVDAIDGKVVRRESK